MDKATVRAWLAFPFNADLGLPPNEGIWNTMADTVLSVEALLSDVWKHGTSHFFTGPSPLPPVHCKIFIGSLSLKSDFFFFFFGLVSEIDIFSEGLSSSGIFDGFLEEGSEGSFANLIEGTRMMGTRFSKFSVITSRDHNLIGVFVFVSVFSSALATSMRPTATWIMIAKPRHFRRFPGLLVTGGMVDSTCVLYMVGDTCSVCMCMCTRSCQLNSSTECTWSLATRDLMYTYPHISHMQSICYRAREG